MASKKSSAHTTIPHRARDKLLSPQGAGAVSEILTSFRINLSLFGEKSGGDLWSGKGSLTLSKTGTDVRRHGLARGCPDEWISTVRVCASRSGRRLAGVTKSRRRRGRSSSSRGRASRVLHTRAPSAGQE